jgi:hypothetical protein
VDNSGGESVDSGPTALCISLRPCGQVVAARPESRHQQGMKLRTVLIAVLVFVVLGLPSSVRDDAWRAFLDGLGVDLEPYLHTAGEWIRDGVREVTGVNEAEARAEHDKCVKEHDDAIASANTDYTKLTRAYEACRDEHPGQIGVYCRDQWRAWHATAMRIDALNANDPCDAPA